jgi:hypothetical protein
MQMVDSINRMLCSLARQVRDSRHSIVELEDSDYRNRR